MSYVNFKRNLTRAQIELLGETGYDTAVDGKIYFATDGGVWVGGSDGKAHLKADLSGNDEDGETYIDSNKEFLFRPTADGSLTSTDINRGQFVEMKGKSCVWNQLVKNGNFAGGTTSWENITSVNNGIATVVKAATGSATTINGTQLNMPYIVGHKYLFLLNVKSNNVATKISFIPTATASQGVVDYALYSSWTKLSYIWTCPATFGTSLQIRGYNVLDPDTDIDFSFTNVLCIDLTLLGIDNLTTVAEVEEWLEKNVGLRPYYAYNAGTILSFCGQTLKTVGFNQWDEQWELGDIDSTGINAVNNNKIRSKNYIPVTPDTVYYFKSPVGFNLFMYDINKNLVIAYNQGSGTYKYVEANSTKQTLSNVRYIRFSSIGTSTTTYNHDICINLSNASKNGTYEPYITHSLPVNITTLTGKKLVGGVPTGSSQVILPTGARRAGSIADSVIVERVGGVPCITKIVRPLGSVDMGTLTWTKYTSGNHTFSAGIDDKRIVEGIGDSILVCAKYDVTERLSYANADALDKVILEQAATSPGGNRVIISDSAYASSDAATFKSAMNGVTLIYELATPETWVLDTPVPVQYIVDPTGTEQWVPENGDTPYTIPCQSTIMYTSGESGAGLWKSGEGEGSVMMDNDNQAKNTSEVALGQYNKSNRGSGTYGSGTNTAGSVGVGTGANDRKNALEVMQNGDMYVKGIGGYDGTNAAGTSISTLQTVLALLESGKQDALTFDAYPTEGSLNPVTSAGIYAALVGMHDVRDLSMYDVSGVKTLFRNTANCYVVRSPGVYKIPLVYGNGVKNGQTNSVAYTRQGSTYTADFVNHLGATLTSPYIEENAGCSAAGAGLLWQTKAGVVNGISLTSGQDCRYLQFNVTEVPSTNALAVLYITDSNDDIIWSWMIWMTADNLAPFTLTNYTSVDYDMLGLPLGAVWNAAHDHYVIPHYQWGRKDPMCPPTTYNSTTNMTLYDVTGATYTGFGNYGVANDGDAGGTVRSVANSIKMPNKFFLQYNTTTYNWNNLAWFNNFWNAAETASSSLADNQDTAIKTIYDPSPAGYMLPAGRFATGFTTTGANSSTTSEFNVIGSWSNGWTIKKNSIDKIGVYFPACGYRNGESGGLGNVGSIGSWWTFAPYSQTLARYLSFSSTIMYPLNGNYRASGFEVWPSRE